MAAPDLVDLSGVMDDAKCFAFVRQHLCQRVCVALGVAALWWPRTDAMTGSSTGNSIVARHARGASTT